MWLAADTALEEGAADDEDSSQADAPESIAAEAGAPSDALIDGDLTDDELEDLEAGMEEEDAVDGVEGGYESEEDMTEDEKLVHSVTTASKKRQRCNPPPPPPAPPRMNWKMDMRAGKTWPRNPPPPPPELLPRCLLVEPQAGALGFHCWQGATDDQLPTFCLKLHASLHMHSKALMGNIQQAIGQEHDRRWLRMSVCERFVTDAGNAPGRTPLGEPFSPAAHPLPDQGRFHIGDQLSKMTIKRSGAPLLARSDDFTGTCTSPPPGTGVSSLRRRHFPAGMKGGKGRLAQSALTGLAL